ncbi:hypothetical protein [Paenarthrobacter nicotinovorans]|uniref:hypothetical protein n=1 Tax=Paenarthrobacter nicotinovorans TaxID=29320 RepID=UPI003D67D1B5
MNTPKKARRRSTRAPHQERRIRVIGVQRERPDLRKLSRAVIAMAQADAERAAQSEHESNRRPRGGAAHD